MGTMLKALEVAYVAKPSASLTPAVKHAILRHHYQLRSLPHPLLKAHQIHST